jgi:type IV pilus assembly protein PilF
VFVRVPERKTLPISAHGVTRVWSSNNLVSLAVPGLEAEPAQAFVVEHANAGGTHNVYVYVLLTQTHTPVVYVSSSPPVEKARLAALEADAIAFVESMGFFVDDLNVHGLPLLERVATVSALPFLKEKPHAVNAAEEELLDEVQPEAFSPTDLLHNPDAMPEDQRLAWARFLASFCLLFFFACAAEVTEKDRVDARIQYDVGVEQLSKGNIAQALTAFNVSESLDASFADAQNALGLTNYALRRYDEARKHYERALELRPGWSEAHNNMGTLLMMQGDFDKAIPHFKSALRDVLYDSPSHAEGNMGYAYFKKGDRVLGIKHIKNATLVNPKFCRGYLWLGEIYQGGQEMRDAERYLDRFVERCVLDPNMKSGIDAASKSEAYMRLGQVTLATGQGGRARVAFRACMDAGEDTPSYDACARSLQDLP